jgi:hypothetical protein
MHHGPASSGRAVRAGDVWCERDEFADAVWTAPNRTAAATISKRIGKRIGASLSLESTHPHLIRIRA